MSTKAVTSSSRRGIRPRSGSKGDKETLMTLSYYTVDTRGKKPPPMKGQSCVYHRMSLYVFGGYRGNYSSDMWKFDCKRSVWEKVIPKSKLVPPKRTDHVACVYQGRMLVFGGDGGLRKPFNDVWAFDFQSRTWNCIMRDTSSTGASPTRSHEVPSGRYGHGACIVGKKMFVFGGYSGMYLNDLFILHLDHFRWERVEMPEPSENHPIPQARAFHSFISSSPYGCILYGGSRGAEDVLDDFWTLNPKSLNWKRVLYPKSHCPLPRCRAAADAFRNHFILFGGSVGGGVRANDFWVFNLTSRKWRRHECPDVHQIPYPRDSATISIVRSGMSDSSAWLEAVLFGGKSDASYLQDTVIIHTEIMDIREPDEEPEELAGRDEKEMGWEEGDSIVLDLEEYDGDGSIEEHEDERGIELGSDVDRSKGNARRNVQIQVREKESEMEVLRAFAARIEEVESDRIFSKRDVEEGESGEVDTAEHEDEQHSLDNEDLESRLRRLEGLFSIMHEENKSDHIDMLSSLDELQPRVEDIVEDLGDVAKDALQAHKEIESLKTTIADQSLQIDSLRKAMSEEHSQRIQSEERMKVIVEVLSKEIMAIGKTIGRKPFGMSSLQLRQYFPMEEQNEEKDGYEYEDDGDDQYLGRGIEEKETHPEGFEDFA